jgi:ketosteroid isomerase-like protein
MSQENVEIVRRFYELFNRGDWIAWADQLDEAVEYVNAVEAVIPGTRHGRDATLAAFQDFHSMWQAPHIEVEKLIATEEQVVALVRFSGAGGGSGVPTSRVFGDVITVHAGKIVRFEWFGDPTQALEAVGLSEQDAHADT